MTQIASGRATGDGTNEKQASRSATEEQAMDHVRGLLEYIGEDLKRDGLRDTPRRVVTTMAEHFRGYQEDPAQYLMRTFEDAHGYRELVLVSDIELYSHCEHHMVPFVGKAHVAYIPNGRMVGISKLAR
ncbi:MAG: GTP cyclohydrolase I, partial [Planctomycetota bacterium]